MDKIRSFIALEFSEEAKAELSRAEEILKEADANVKWVKPESAHITLKFLGDVQEEKIPHITARLEEIARETSPFDICLEDIGVFPKWDFPRVLWIGIGEGKDNVKSLAEKVEAVMVQENFEKERRSFSPHITIGRIKSAKNKKKLQEIASSIEVKPAASHISRLVLFRSDLSPKGAVHTPLSILDFSA